MDARVQDIAIRLFVIQSKAFTVSKFSNIFARWQPRQVVEWWVNQCLKAVYALTIRELILPNSSYEGTSFILSVKRLKPTATRYNIRKLYFSHKCVSVYLLCVIITMSK
jgi:hypothetical protein